MPVSNKIKIFVASHKPTEIYSDDLYKPIHVGRAISTCTDQMDMIGDDTGDNISEKNPYYSELTAQYWVWKNYNDSEYIGFCHYRRYFAKSLTPIEIEKMFNSGVDVFVVGPCWRRYTRWNFLQTFVSSEDLAIMQMVVRKIYPDYYKTLSGYAYDFVDYPLNMFICKKDLFDKYAEWLFAILFECEKHVRLSSYTRARRLYGYLGEFLMPVYFIHNGCQMKAIGYHCVGEKGTRGGLSLFQKTARWVLRNVFYIKDKNRKLGIDYSVAAGLQNDGISILANNDLII